MKRLFSLLVVFVMMLSAVPSFPTTHAQDEGTGPAFINHNGQDLFLSGINLAWMDFARDLTDFDEVEFVGVLDEVAAAHGNTIRWWLHTNGSVSPIYGEDGKVTGLNENEIENLHRALDLAYERGILLMLCLWSHDMMKEAEGIPTEFNQLMIEDPEYTQAYIDNALIPLVEGVKGHPGIIAWEIFNEPEGTTTEFGWTEARTTMPYIQQFVNLLAGAIRRTDPDALVTNGSWSFRASTDVGGYTNYYTDERLIEAGGDPDGTLDFYQVHFYPQHMDESVSPWHHPASYWELDKPVMIGEFPAAGIMNLGTGYLPSTSFQNIIETMEYTYQNGYAGALGWAYSDTAFGGMIDLAAGLHWLYRLGPETIAVNVGDLDHIPTIVAPIENLIVSNDTTSAQAADLNQVFNDAEDGTNLTYEVTGNSAPDLMQVAIDEAGLVTLTFAEGVMGSSTLEITATDSGGNFSKVRFVVQITDPDLGNVALGKPTTASTIEGNGYVAEFATDGLDNTRWSTEYADEQWLRVDLDGVFDITQFVLKWETAFGKSYEIQVWDGSAWQTVVTEENSDGAIDDFLLDAPVPARYIRFHGIQRGTEWGFSLWEFQVNGARSENQDQPVAQEPPAEEAANGGDTAAVETERAPLYNFESDIEGWVMADYWAGGQGLEQSAEMVSDGAGALKLNLLTSGTAWEEGGVYVDPATPLDLSAATYVTADVYVPAEATNFIAQIFVKTGEEWTWANSADTALTPGEWTTIRADLSTLGNAADVREIGVKVGSGSTAFEGPIFIDNLAIETVLNAPEPVAVETTSETLHSFEADVEGWVMADYWAGGQGLEQSADMASDGAGALKLNLLTSGTAWEEGGVYVDLATPLDLSTATYVTADVYVPAEAANFIGQIFVKTGEEWTWANTADTALTPGEWTTITGDLSTLGNIADVREIGVKVGSGSTAFEGPIYIDNIAVVTEVAAAEPVAVETASESLHSFEADVEGWVMADYWAGGQGLEQSADMASDGTGALKLNLLTSGTAWEEGGAYVDPATPLDLSAAVSITADVYVPAEATNFLAQIFVKTGEEWTWANTADTALTPGEWTTVTADLSTLGNIADVREIGVKVGSGSTAFEGPIYIDNIMIVSPVN